MTDSDAKLSTRSQMDDVSRSLCMCPIKGIIDIIAKKWSLLVINAIANHERIRFNELMKELSSVSPRTLTETLKSFQQFGLVKRTACNEIPPRLEYSLTEDGWELREAIIPLLQWALNRTDDAFKSCCGLLDGNVQSRDANVWPSGTSNKK